MATGQRATREEQKRERRQAILDTAWRQFQQTSYEAVTMAGIAEALGLAKGTMYLYFNTKEELFLAVEEQWLADWLDQLAARLEAGRGPFTPLETATVLTQTLLAKPGMARLLAILHTTLERNIDLAAALRFKHMLLERLTGVGTRLEQRLPFLAPGDGLRVLLRCDALIIGLWHLSDPAPVVREAFAADATLGVFAVDFASELRASFAALLAGMAAGA